MNDETTRDAAIDETDAQAPNEAPLEAAADLDVAGPTPLDPLADEPAAVDAAAEEGTPDEASPLEEIVAADSAAEPEVDGDGDNGGAEQVADPDDPASFTDAVDEALSPEAAEPSDAPTETRRRAPRERRVTDRAEMEAAIEAILFVSSEPIPRTRLLEMFDEEERAEAEGALAAILERFAPDPARGFMAEEVAGGIRFATRPELVGWLRRFFEVSAGNKLSVAALETLAIIAYRQPITGPEIQELRGVSAAGTLKTLLERRLVRIAGRKEVVGKPFLYCTTREFLVHFGLKGLGDLPPLEEFEETFGLESAFGVSDAEVPEGVAETPAEAEATALLGAVDEARERTLLAELETLEERADRNDGITGDIASEALEAGRRG